MSDVVKKLIHLIDWLGASIPTLASHFFPLKWHFLPIIEVYWGPQLPHRSLEDKSEEVAYGCSMSSIVLSSLLSVSNWAATWKYPQITDDANEPNNQASHQRHPHQRQTRTKVSVLLFTGRVSWERVRQLQPRRFSGNRLLRPEPSKEDIQLADVRLAGSIPSDDSSITWWWTNITFSPAELYLLM